MEYSTYIFFMLMIQYFVMSMLYWFDNLNAPGSRMCLDQVSDGFPDFMAIYTMNMILSLMCMGFVLGMWVLGKGGIIACMIFACLFNIALIVTNFFVIFPNAVGERASNTDTTTATGIVSIVTPCWITFTIPILVFAFFNFFLLLILYKLRISELNSW